VAVWGLNPLPLGSPRGLALALLLSVTHRVLTSMLYMFQIAPRPSLPPYADANNARRFARCSYSAISGAHSVAACTLCLFAHLLREL
jgi:hypothetical protein